MQILMKFNHKVSTSPKPATTHIRVATRNDEKYFQMLNLDPLYNKHATMT
jgi:hypothetical protein